MPLDMQNCLDHMRGGSVNVDGTVYRIGEDGVARGVAEKDAAVLAQNKSAWRILKTSVNVVERKPARSAKVQEVEISPMPMEIDPEEWPDPTEEMDLEYLQRMADAYQVSYVARTTKARLIRDIMQAMYP